MFGLKDLPHPKAAKAQPFEHGTSCAFICRSDRSGKEQVNLSGGAKTSRPSLHANSLRGCIAREKLMSRSSPKLSLTAAMPERLPSRRPRSRSKLSGSRPIRWGLRCIRAVGSWNGSSHGSVETDGSGRIQRRRSRQPERSFTPLPSCSLSAAWDDTHDYGTDFKAIAQFRSQRNSL